MKQSWQMWSACLNDEIIDSIISAAGETQKASTFSDNGSDVRVSRIAWLTNLQWLQDMLHHYADGANQNAFHVNLFKRADIQFTEYHASEGGHYS